MIKTKFSRSLNCSIRDQKIVDAQNITTRFSLIYYMFKHIIYYDVYYIHVDNNYYDIND